MASRDRQIVPLFVAPSKSADRKVSGERNKRASVEIRNTREKRIFIR